MPKEIRIFVMQEAYRFKIPTHKQLTSFFFSLGDKKLFKVHRKYIDDIYLPYGIRHILMKGYPQK